MDEITPWMGLHHGWDYTMDGITPWMRLHEVLMCNARRPWK